MNLRALGMAAALLAIGFAAGAWWMDARRAVEIAELEAAASRSMVADLAALSGAVPGPALPGASIPAPAPERTAIAAADAPGRTVPAASDAPRASKPLPPEIAELVGRLMSQDRDHEAQKRDAAWAGTEEGKIRALIAGSPTLLPPGATIGEIDCRTTTCRVLLSRMPDEGKPGVTSQVQDVGTLFGSLDYGVWMTSAGVSAPGTTDWYIYLRPGISKSAEPGAVR